MTTGLLLGLLSDTGGWHLGGEEWEGEAVEYSSFDRVPVLLY